MRLSVVGELYEAIVNSGREMRASGASSKRSRFSRGNFPLANFYSERERERKIIIFSSNEFLRSIREMYQNIAPSFSAEMGARRREPTVVVNHRGVTAEQNALTALR